jgi:hypothetical protein
MATKKKNDKDDKGFHAPSFHAKLLAASQEYHNEHGAITAQFGHTPSEG